jgi:hypothetical protein
VNLGFGDDASGVQICVAKGAAHRQSPRARIPLPYPRWADESTRFRV